MAVSLISSPSRVTMWRARSMVSGPALITAWLVAGLGLGRMVQRHPDARQQLFDPERLGQVIVRAFIQGAHLIPFAVAHRKDDDRHLGPLPQLLAHLDPVHIRQAQVEDDQVRRLGRRQGQPLFAPGGNGHPELLGAQDGVQARKICGSSSITRMCGFPCLFFLRAFGAKIRARRAAG